MTETGEFEALRHAVLTASFSPEGLPERVAAAAVLAATPTGSPSRSEFLRWGVEPSTTTSATAVGALAYHAYTGSITRDIGWRVADAYGFRGVVAAVGIGAAARLFDRVRTGAPPAGRIVPPRPVPGDEARPTLIRIRRSFDQVPPPWAIMAWQPRALSRWWELHDRVMTPALLTGDEKWLAMIAVAGPLGLEAFGAACAGLLSSWSGDEIEAAIKVESKRLRQGVRSALVSIGGYAIGTLESERFELAAAAMPAARAGEFRRIVDVAAGLAAFNPLS